MSHHRTQFQVSNVCSAFADRTIGTKVLDREAFFALLDAALEHYDTSDDRVPGQHYIVLPPEATTCVSAGVGYRTDNPNDYILRSHRGRVNAYLKRERLAQVSSVAVVVYTRGAYLADSDASTDPLEADFEGTRIRDSVATHVIVAVLASAGPPSPLTPYRFAANLAGGNNEALTWTADQIRAKAAEVVAYAHVWDVVAD